MPKNDKGDDFLTTLIGGTMLIVTLSTLAILFINWILS